MRTNRHSLAAGMGGMGTAGVDDSRNTLHGRHVREL